jgi:hypothetical protein
VNVRAAAGALGVGLLGAFAVTLVFTAQNAASGTGTGWIGTIAPNALHWGIWALFAPALLLVTRRYRLGAHEFHATRDPMGVSGSRIIRRPRDDPPHDHRR